MLDTRATFHLVMSPLKAAASANAPRRTSRKQMLEVTAILMLSLSYAHQAIAAARQVEPSSPQTATVAEWRRLSEKQPGNRTARSMLGLAMFHSGELDARTVQLLEGCAETDWVALSHAAAAYSMIARRLSRVDGGKEAAALERAAALFSAAERARQRPQSVPYPQIAYAQERTLVLRSWGDALAWLGRESDARQVFLRGFDEGLWRHPLCRSTRELPTIRPTLPLPRFFIDASVFPWVTSILQPQLDIITAEFRAFSASQALAGKPSGREETAGLHVHSERGLVAWTQLPLMVNGMIQANACAHGWKRTCALLRSIPELQLKQGQAKISVLQPGTVIRPHCGPVNDRLRMHCGLVVPSESNRSSPAFLQVRHSPGSLALPAVHR